MKILALDSATESATCSILDDNKVLGEITFNFKKQHSIILMPMIENLLKNLQLSINDIDGYVVSKGPGSFTGLRIGIATIKGLCHGTNKPFVSVSTLDALANNLAYTSGIICPVLDALRGNVYTALYVFENAELKKITEYLIISVEELIVLLQEKNANVTFIGDALIKYESKFKSELKNTNFAPSHLNLAKASSLGEIGMKLLSEGKFDDVFTFSPFYLRKSQAEREYDKKMGTINE
jgi:tRNA threonylcarbamoyladenosine biosynthesis protein TsaB